MSIQQSDAITSLLTGTELTALSSRSEVGLTGICLIYELASKSLPGAVIYVVETARVRLRLMGRDDGF